MITYLPELYPDELAYSWFCRYYAHSGYLTHKSALEDILYKRHNNPSKEFLGRLSADMTEAIKRKYTIEDIILKHTMVPQYARFIPLDQKKNAVFHIGYDFCDAHHLFAILPRHETDAYLKYCPICANEDRHKYGEAYWHRTHQLRNIQVCDKHGCLLRNSTIPAKSEGDFTLCPAETNIATENPVMESNKDRYALTKYICDIFNSPVDFENNVPISAVLYNAMKKSRYMKSSGKSRYTKQLADDIQVYYRNIDLPDIASIYQIQRVLLGDRYDFSVVCQIAYYLGMSITELTAPKLTEKEVSEEQESHYIKNRERINWAVYDAETAPKLESVAYAIYNGTANSSGRPERVSEKIIYREMGLPQHRLEILPMCRAVFEKYAESYEENWARRIIWAYNKLSSEDKPFYWSDIRRLTGVKKANINKVIPHIKKQATRKVARDIIRIIE